MYNFVIIIIGKLLSKFISAFKLGSGSTWPGHIALKLNRNFVKDTMHNSSSKKVLIAGTNGKTTTGKLITSILTNNGFIAFHNDFGANLLNGIASSLILNSSFLGKIKSDYAIFEVDENALPITIESINPDFIILLNLFRDQLDRYGEIDSIAKKWKEIFNELTTKTKLVLNADDPLIASLGLSLKNKAYYFGLNDKALASPAISDVADSIFCLNCSSKLNYDAVYFSHLGNWSCPKCSFKKPKLDIEKFSTYPLPGTYNMYNTLASVLFAKLSGILEKNIASALKGFKPAFGRQEIIKTNGKEVVVLLSKNPTSFNESLRTVKKLCGKDIFIILNNRIPDGRDVSWIYDIDFENLLTDDQSIVVSGDRAYDMTMRIKYADHVNEVHTFENFKDGIDYVLNKMTSKRLFVLPTYSAMLDFRKELVGRKLL
jgi:UDP-N-acetylmuramyl tripeptide synthase